MITDAPFWMECLKNPNGGPRHVNLLSILVPFLEGRARYKPQDLSKLATPSSYKSTHEPFTDKIVPPPDTFYHKIRTRCVSGFTTLSIVNKGEPYNLSETSETTIRLLQHVLMFVSQLSQIRYKIPAMSISWDSSCLIEKETRKLVVNGVLEPPLVNRKMRYKSCVCGDTFIALLSNNNDVYVAGILDPKGSSSSSTAVASESRLLRKMSTNTMMIVGTGTSLFALTNSYTIRPISPIPVGTKNIIPYRLCRYIALGLGEECYMIGMDNILYKIVQSPRYVGTPRRVMTFSRIGVSRVSSGCGFIFAIDLGGRLYSIGKNKKGQLGNGAVQPSMRKPYQHRHLNHHFFISVATGNYHAVALASDGTAYSCGSNEHGQLGLGGNVKEALVLTKVDALPSRCTSVVAGPTSSLFACEDGRVYACGANDSKQLGISEEYQDSLQGIVYVPTPMRNITSGVLEMTLKGFGNITIEDIKENNFLRNEEDSVCISCCKSH